MWVRCDGTTYPCSTCQVAAKLSGSGCSSTDSVACSAPHVNPHVRYVIQAGTSTESNESHVRAETCHCFPVAFAGQIWLQLISGARSWLGSLGEVSLRLVRMSRGAVDEVREAAKLLEMPPIPVEQPSVVVARTQYFSLGKQEIYVLYSSDACAVTLRLFEHWRSPAKEAGIAVLVFGGAADLNRELTKHEDDLLNQLHGHGFGTVVFVGLCGQGDPFWRGGLWQFAPLLLGKSHVGYHGSEVLATVAWAFRQLRCHHVVLMARGSSSAAVLHAAPHVPHLAAVVLLYAVAELADVVRVRKHRLPWQMQVHGVLKHYDLPDLLAALPKSVAIAVANPLGAKRNRLSWSQALRSYRLAARFRGMRLRVLLGEDEATCLQIARFLKRLFTGAAGILT
ncbi:HMCN1 [Symbiodinium natans]|uniref:HMCN1 protein n=1 Tax=Symbiodinium natans TaxID=878477 RepID=A0A812LI79_9DINO|nr:HMCN1 [Symbiodinium natans]